MNLTAEQLRIIKSVIGVIEVGMPEGGYDNVTILRDGPGDIRQVTFGRFQTTEYSHLKELVRRYIDAPGEVFDGPLRAYLPRIGKTPLADDKNFIRLLRTAAQRDPEMAKVQERFFEEVYFQPALTFCRVNGFKRALSALVIFDSFIHGGLSIVRKLFPEVPPAKGGKEAAWVMAYVNARHRWLANHKREALRWTIYRTRCWKEQLARGNWDLAFLPIKINGVNVR